MAGDQAEPANADSALALISSISFEMNWILLYLMNEVYPYIYLIDHLSNEIV